MSIESAKSIIKRWATILGPDECWPFKQKFRYDGYGIITVRRKTKRAHREAYQAAFGPIPDGVVVCHRCDNPICQNPAHLFVGTHMENCQDKLQKGRGRGAPRGLAHMRGKLTDAQVCEIRTRSTGGERPVDLAKEFGVSQQLVSNIKSGHHRPRAEPGGDELEMAQRPPAPMNAALASEVRRRALAGEPHSALAREYGIRVSAVSSIRRRKTWKNA